MAWNNRYSRPDPNKVYVESFQNLTGGMNRFDLDYRLKGNESPFMQNLSWHNGTLTSRLGQVEKYAMGVLHEHRVRGVAPFLFHGWLVFWYEEDTSSNRISGFVRALKVKLTGEAETESAIGTGRSAFAVTRDESFEKIAFFQYRENLYIKAKDYYARAVWDHADDSIEIEFLAGYGDTNKTVYIPTIQKNTNPASGAGDEFQKENRLTGYKRVQFDVTAAGTTSFQLPITGITHTERDLAYTGVPGEPSYEEYEISSQSDWAAGTIILTTAPPVDSELVIEFYKPNPGAYSSIMATSTGIVFGGSQDLCVVLGGPEAQPNAYFWSDNNGLVMDPTYFPMDYYNLAGENDDPITAFGKQQNMLVIFQPNATGRAVFGTTKVNDLERVTMNYTRINAEIGCDLPGSLQLVENNLVWCNRRYGVCRLKDSSAAYENNIVQISRKINGDYRLDGLLEQLKSVADNEVRSVDTGKRYILVLGDEDGKAYEWNYELSQYDNPSWFYHTNILGVGFVPLANEELYEVTADGKVCTFEMVFKDFDDTPINKIYRFPPRDFGSYDRLKNIKSILVTTRSDAKTNTQLKYTCDYAERVDPTNLVVVLNRLLYAAVFRRKPGYHNIHHLGIELSNNVAGDDLNIVSAQIFYEYRGRTR